MPNDKAQLAIVDKAAAVEVKEGKYLYCIAASGERANLGPIGIDGHEVHTIPHRDICAIVHDCPAAPYQSADPEVVRAWVLTHQRVVDAAWGRWATVLPLGFDTIVVEPEDNIMAWLQQNYGSLKVRLERVRGKAEYGVQVFWDARVIARKLSQTNPEIGKLKETIKSKPVGIAYLYTQKLDNLLKRDMESKADECFSELYQRIHRHVDDIIVEKTKASEQGLQMLMNLSCLLSVDKAEALGAELETIAQTEGFLVRFTGPWPPYSFASI